MKQEIKERIEQINSGIVPDGYRKTKIGIVPNDWKYEKLENFLIQYQETSEYNNQYPVLTSSRKGIFLQTEYYSRVVASENNTGYNIVPRGYFTYRHMSDDEIFKFNINNIVDKGIVSTLYPVFTTKNICDYFLQVLLNEGKEFRRYALLQKQGGSRTYMYFDKLTKLKLYLPSVEEQERISIILETQDKIIEIKEKILKEKELKNSYYLKSLTNGEIKIKSLNSEWVNEKCPFEFEKGEQINKNTLSNCGKYAVYNGGVLPSGFTNKFNCKNQIIISEGGNSCGYVNYIKDAFWAGGHCFHVTYSCIESDYLYYMLKAKEKNIMNLRVGSGLPNIQMSSLKAMSFRYPVSKETRSKIVVILNSLNKEIFILEKQIEQEKQKKKALMQLLLTGIVRV